MKVAVITFLLLALCLLAPNLVWLGFSTARITNVDPNTVYSVTVYVNDKKLSLGDIRAGESRFLILPASGDATYKVLYGEGADVKSVCNDYVQRDMHHVETVLEGVEGSRCKVSLPLFSELLFLKLI